MQTLCRLKEYNVQNSIGWTKRKRCISNIYEIDDFIDDNSSFGSDVDSSIGSGDDSFLGSGDLRAVKPSV